MERGRGVAHEVHQNGPKWTKMDQNGHHFMTEQKCSKFVLSNIFDLFLDYMDTWKGIGVSATHGGVMGSHMRCTQMHQNAPKWTKMVRCSKFPPCVPIFYGGSLVTVWGGVRWEPASESLWDEQNQYKNSSKLEKMAQNGQNPALWPLVNVGWHWAVNSISLCIKWYNPLHRHLIEVKKLIWAGGGLRGAPQGVTFGQMGLGVTMHQKSWKKNEKNFFQVVKIFLESFTGRVGVRLKG